MFVNSATAIESIPADMRGVSTAALVPNTSRIVSATIAMDILRDWDVMVGDNSRAGKSDSIALCVYRIAAPLHAARETKCSGFNHT